MTTLYSTSLLVIVCSAAFATLHPAIRVDFVSMMLIGAAAVFALAGLETSPPNWLVGLTVAEALLCLWLLGRWSRTRPCRAWLAVAVFRVGRLFIRRR